MESSVSASPPCSSEPAVLQARAPVRRHSTGKSTHGFCPRGAFLSVGEIDTEQISRKTQGTLELGDAAKGGYKELLRARKRILIRGDRQVSPKDSVKNGQVGGRWGGRKGHVKMRQYWTWRRKGRVDQDSCSCRRTQ